MSLEPGAFLIQDEPEGAKADAGILIVRVEAGRKLSLEEIRAFLEASDAVAFEGRNRDEVYGWVDQTLRAQAL